MKKFKLIVILAIVPGILLAGCKREGKKDNIAATTYTLNATATNGTVIKNPNLTAYNSGTTVQLIASPNSGYTFASWGGDVTGSTNPLLVTMYANKNITANFTVLVVNVKSTGATGNGSTDDTGAIQAAVNQVAGTGGTVLVPAGTYMIDALTSVKLGSDMTFKMDSGAVLKAKPNDQGGYDMIIVSGKTNVNIVGGKVQGERHQHLTAGDFVNHSQFGEWGMGIRIGAASSHISVTGVTVTECWGDGIYIGGGAVSTDITLSGVVCDDNRRQGMSITWADGVLVQNSSFNNTNGTSPMAGIDIEPNSGNYVRNVRILNNQFINNLSKGIIIYSSLSPNPEISNITVTGNTVSGANWGISLNNTRSGITISNNTLTNQRIDALGVWGSLSINNTFSNNTISVIPPYTDGLTTHVGIRFADGATGNTAIHNTISGYQYPIYQDGVSGNTVSPNP